MHIKVFDGKYVISSDTYNFILREIGTNKKGEEVAKSTCYPGTMEQCLQTIVNWERRDNNCSSLQGYIKHITAIEKQLEESLKKMATALGSEETVKRVLYYGSQRLPKEVKDIGKDMLMPKSEKGGK